VNLPAEAAADRFGAQARFVVLLVKAAAMRRPTSPTRTLRR
jgi:hypothetical protein